MPHGDICRIELSTRDLSASKVLYREALGWTFEGAPGMQGLPLFRIPGGLGGGANAGPGTEAPIGKGLIFHVDTDDIDATLAQPPSLGKKSPAPEDEGLR